MKQQDKKALLTRILQGETTTSTVKRLFKPESKSLTIVFEPHSHKPQPTDEVIVETEPDNITMPYSELEEYARRVGGIVVVKIPRPT